MNKKILLILGLITLLGAGLRLWQINNLPPILNRDEAALAYNGFLLNQVQQDEFGRSLPLTFESFGDYKLPGYPYALALLFSFLPTADWVVRLPSALSGILLIPLSFWLAKQLKLTDQHSLLLSFLVAITPIFIFYSRIAFEANVALTLLVLFLGLLLKFSQQKKLSLLNLSLLALVLILAISFYNTPLLLAPFFVIGLPLLWGVKKHQQWLTPVAVITLIFIISFAALNSISAQKSGITIFSDQTVWQNFVEYRSQFIGISQLILGNKYFYYLQIIFKNLLNTFSPSFLVTNGGSHPWHSLPDWGHLLWSVYFLGVLGFISNLIKVLKSFPFKRILTHSQPQIFLIFLTISSLAPAVITVDAPHATRSLLFFYLWLIWAVLGFKIILDNLNKKIRLLAVGLLVLILLVETIFYGYQYFVIYPSKTPISLRTGFAQIIQQVETEHPTQEVAIVDSSGYQYILTAWYLKIPAQDFLETVIKQQPNQIGFKYGQQVTHYHFIAQPEDRSETETVLVEWIGQKWQIREY